MSRNVLVGGVVFGLVLAGLAVGISTFMSAQDMETRAGAQEARIAGVESGLASAEGRLADDMGTLLPASNAVADNLSSQGFLWSKGRLVVSQEEADTSIAFEVVPGESGEVRVLAPLVVSGDAELGDFLAGVATVNQLVSSNGIRDASDSWVVDPQGNVKIKGDYTGAGLKVSKLEVGEGGFIFDSSYGKLLVDGAIVAREYTSPGTEATLFLNDVQFGKTISALGGGWTISQAGAASFKSMSADSATAKSMGTRSINAAADKWWVASSGNAKLGAVQAGSATVASALSSGSFTTAGAANVGSLTSGGAVTANQLNGGAATITGTATVTGGLTSGSLSTGVINATGATNLSGRLTVQEEVHANVFELRTADAFRVDGTGMTLGNKLVVDDEADVTGDMSVGGNLDVAGTISGIFEGDFNVDGKDVTLRDVTASRTLRSGPPGSYRFVVDNSGTAINGALTVTGNSQFNGDVAVTGSVTGGSFTTAGAASVGSLSVGGTAVNPSNIPDFYRAGAATVNGSGSVTVPVAGMLAGDAVIVTPRFDTAGTDYYAVPAAAEFTIHGPEGSYSWIVAR